MDIQDGPEIRVRKLTLSKQAQNPCIFAWSGESLWPIQIHKRVLRTSRYNDNFLATYQQNIKKMNSAVAG